MPVVGSTSLSMVSSAPSASFLPLLPVVGLHRAAGRPAGVCSSTVGMLSSGIVKITVIGWSWVMMTRPPVSAACTMLPGSTRRSPTRPVDGRGDATVDEIDLRGLDLALVVLDRALELVNQRVLGVQLLPRHRVRLDEHLEPLEIDPGVVEQRLIALQLAFELGQLRLEWARIDLGQQVSAADDLPFLEMDAEQLAVHPGSHRDGIEWRDRPEPVEVDPDVARPCRRRYHRDARRGREGSLRAGGGSPVSR